MPAFLPEQRLAFGHVPRGAWTRRVDPPVCRAAASASGDASAHGGDRATEAAAEIEPRLRETSGERGGADANCGRGVGAVGSAPMARAETILEQAERHVRESQERIKRHKKLMDEMEAHGHHRMLPAALKLLDQMQEFHRLALEHRELERAKTRPRG
jgi:hypothetical protein